jgi:hypothetical protein
MRTVELYRKFLTRALKSRAVQKEKYETANPATAAPKVD